MVSTGCNTPVSPLAAETDTNGLPSDMFQFFSVSSRYAVSVIPLMSVGMKS